MPFPKIEGYVVTEKLGSGSYSTVYKAYTKVGARSIVAVKCVDKSRIKNSGTAVDNLITEIRLLKTLTHPHIVHMKHFTWDDSLLMSPLLGHRPEPMDGIGRLGHDPPRGPSADWWVLTTADAAGTNGLTCLPKHGGVRDSKFLVTHPMTDHCESVIMYECLFGKAPYSSNTFKELVDKIQSQAKIQAVALIKQAIELDCRHISSATVSSSSLDRLHQARTLFGLYRDGLRYLVPCVSAETDAVRRGALTDKLTRYMERAEEIKQYIKYAESGAASPPAGAGHAGHAGHAGGGGGARGGGTTSTTTCQYGHTRKLACTSCDTTSNSQRQTDNSCRCSTNNDNGDAIVPDNEPVEIKGRATQAIAEASKASVRSRTPPRFGLKRLFGRQHSVPYLDNKDSSIADNTTEKQRVPSEDSSNDGCRIT
ncbi:hypothetical protein evm_013291 [Chilo suppressalis]|nr:hypothetical protein evm_013291 [Chilo suppressalis]